MPRNQTVICPICKSRIVKQYFSEHQRLAHDDSYGEESDDKSKEEVASKEKNLDATKGYAHPYREDGKYGSHPSHDGFDDESNP